MQTGAIFLISVIICALFPTFSAHSLLYCPTSRSPGSYGIKEGPCGDVSRSVGSWTNFTPGINTIILAESIYHDGAPWVIQLALDNDQTRYTLLDHIPQDSAYHRPSESYPREIRVNIDIPDIDCDSCALIMYNPMTDKQPSTCTESTCVASYHSCSNIRINGSESPSTWASSYTYSAPSGWPYNGTPGTYGRESVAHVNGNLPVHDIAAEAGPCKSVKLSNSSTRLSISFTFVLIALVLVLLSTVGADW